MKKLTVRVSDAEHEQLLRFCSLNERTQNDVLRQCIRSLGTSGALNPLSAPGSHPDAPLRESAGLPAD
ncbi:MAG: hypothetical protein ACFCU9_14605 [Cyanophyceae cyanobacterium]